MKFTTETSFLRSHCWNRCRKSENTTGASPSPSPTPSAIAAAVHCVCVSARYCGLRTDPDRGNRPQGCIFIVALFPPHPLTVRSFIRTTRSIFYIRIYMYTSSVYSTPRCKKPFRFQAAKMTVILRRRIDVYKHT